MSNAKTMFVGTLIAYPIAGALAQYALQPLGSLHLWRAILFCAIVSLPVFTFLGWMMDRENKARRDSLLNIESIRDINFIHYKDTSKHTSVLQCVVMVDGEAQCLRVPIHLVQAFLRQQRPYLQPMNDSLRTWLMSRGFTAINRRRVVTRSQPASTEGN